MKDNFKVFICCQNFYKGKTSEQLLLTVQQFEGFGVTSALEFVQERMVREVLRDKSVLNAVHVKTFLQKFALKQTCMFVG